MKPYRKQVLNAFSFINQMFIYSFHFRYIDSVSVLSISSHKISQPGGSNIQVFIRKHLPCFNGLQNRPCYVYVSLGKEIS